MNETPRRIGYARTSTTEQNLAPQVAALRAAGCAFVRTEQKSGASLTGRLVFHVFGALGQFERDLIKERTNAGLAAAAARGRKGGRPVVVTPEKLVRARTLVAQGFTVREAATRLKIGKSALYAAFKTNAPPIVADK